ELQYANGTVPITYIWRAKGEGRLAGARPGDGPPLARVFAFAPNGDLLVCDFASRQVVTLDLARIYNPPPRGVQHATPP
ncbi:MAG TPA: hypothetical protein VKB93_06360, partial [Thermoanaerobaculia bacterium]|nr:hypothetical protein [Thermoanaerobaculia bacterium]